MKKNHSKKFLPFALPMIGKEEIKEVTKVLKSGWLTTGPITRKFEEDFKQCVGVKHAVAVNSCTAALHIALVAIGIKPKDEVLVPTMTFTATAEVVTYLGARPVFVDCEEDTLLISVEDLERKITKRTKAIIPVHYAGQACDIKKILNLAKKHNLKVIWDAAHSFPTEYKGRNVGQFPDITCFSFYVTKTIATGEGGMAVTNNKKYAERMRIASLHGMSRDAWKRYQKGGSWYYEIVMPGFKYNLTDIASAIGIWQLKKAKKFLTLRAKIARKYLKAFKKIKEISSLAVRKYGTHAWHLFVIKLNLPYLKINRNRFIEELDDKGIGASVHFIPLHMHPYWKNTYHLKNSDFPNATRAYNQIISLPIYPKMKTIDINRVIRAISDITIKNKK